MKYMGSKRRIAPSIMPIILAGYNQDSIYIEPFAGGCNSLQFAPDNGKRIANDKDRYLIAMWKELQKGWVPVEHVTEELWRSVRSSPELHEDHIRGYVSFCASFGADPNGGFARNVRKDAPNAEILNSTTKSYSRQSRNNILKQLPLLQNITWLSEDYLNLEIPENAIVYCDPPYNGTTGYSANLNHTEFWAWVREKSKIATVFVSEYSAPPDFNCIWQQDINNTLNNIDGNRAVVTEKLFKYEV